MKIKVCDTLRFGDMQLVLYDPKSVPQNLYAYDVRGGLLWIAESQQPRDPYMGIVRDGKILQAHTWNCFTCTLDPATGKIIDSVFTK